MKPTMFFFINSIDLIRGGLTKASLQQASFFAEMGYKTHMLTFNFNPNYPFIRKKLVEMSKLHKNVVVHNMFESLEGYTTPPVRKKPAGKTSLAKISQGHAVEKRKGYNAYRVYENGLYTKYIAFDHDGYLSFIDYFNENRHRTARKTYDPWGNLKRIAFMDLYTNRIKQSLYRNKQGKTYLTQWQNPNSGETEKIIYFDDTTDIKNIYNNVLSHKVDWAWDMIEHYGNSKSVVISDTRSTDDILIHLHQPKAAKIWRLHSHHLEKPLKNREEIVPKVQTGMNNIDTFDCAVFLTEEQKQDVTDLKGNQTGFKVIPHYYEPKTFGLFNRIKRNQNKCVIVSRLSSLKRIDHAVRAFQKVINVFPEVKLEIWGTGNQQKKLNNLIKELDLTNNVFLKDYTHEPDSVYRSGLFSIMTSKKEGFALSVLESMYNQTPVISYDIEYGPADMIKHEDNGMFVQDNNIEELAEKMIYMFNYPKMAAQMGKKAKKYVQNHFNKKIYHQKWQNVIDEALKDRNK